MDPICKACGQRHPSMWTRARCMAQAKPAVETSPQVANTNAAVANRHGVYADKEKRRAYMRELMRKRRSAAP